MNAIHRLHVYLDGHQLPVGLLISWEDGAATFQYAEHYLQQPSAIPISLSLPLAAEPFGDVLTRAFFQNLLPEDGQSVQQVMDLHRIAQSDFVGLLFYLGADCPGAMSCVPENAGPAKVPGVLSTDYAPLTSDDISEFVRRMANREPLPEEVRDPSPVAGVQKKIALTLLPDGSFALPKRGLGAPTTHILKVPRANEGRDARLEQGAAILAAAAGLDVVVPDYLEFGAHPALLLQRYDRRVIDGVAYRLHQEDFAQALGLPATMKYQRRGTADRQFDAKSIYNLLQETAEPGKSITNFLKLTLLNCCVGNADNHAKNHSLLYMGGPNPIMAPAYDLLPTRMNPKLLSEMGFNIGNAKTSEDITSGDLAALFSIFGLSAPAANRFARDEIAPMFQKMDKAGADLGLKDFDDMMGQNLEALAAASGLSLHIRERDYYAPKGGGWASES